MSEKELNEIELKDENSGATEEAPSNDEKDNNLSEELQNRLAEYHSYETTKKILINENIDYHKMDAFFIDLVNKKEVSLSDFNKDELQYVKTLIFYFDDLPLRNFFTREMIVEMYSKQVEDDNLPELYTFFDYDENPDRFENNLKNSEAIRDLICLHDLSPDKIKLLTNRALKDIFELPSLNDNQATFTLISSLLNYPPVKQYVEPEIMNYWFQWSDMLRRECKNVDFDDLSPVNVRNIAGLLKLCQESYVFLEDSGLLPNDGYSDFMPTFIDRCFQSDNYFLQINARYARYQIAHEALFEYSDENPYEGDARWRNILISRAFDLAFSSEEPGDIYERNKEFYDTMGEIIGTLQTVEEDGRTFFQDDFAPGFTGLYDQKYNLIKIKHDDHNLNYEGLSGLNRYGQIDNEGFYDLIAFQNIALKRMVSEDFNVDLSL